MAGRLRLPPFLLEAAIIAAAALESLSTLDWATPVESGLAIVAAVGLLVRRRWPWVSLVLAIPAFTLNLATLAGLVALYSVAVAERRRWRLVVAGAGSFLLAAFPWWGWSAPNYAVLSVVYAGLYAGAPIAFGLLYRTRRELSDRLRELESVREIERRRIEEDALKAERSRIAREMHDVVSHQVSLIAVQAGAIQVHTQEATTKRLVLTIRSLASRTLDELRDMVTVLRADSEVQRLAPQPTVDDLAALIEGSGIEVVEAIDLPDALPPAVQRAMFRTVQEGLTNARKHAPGEVVEITADADAERLVVVVRNRLASAPARSRSDGGRGGFGLMGLRERAELLGGTLQVDEEADAFTVTMRVPL